MKPPIRIDHQVCAGGQPTSNDFTDLHAQGFRTIINLRRASEQNQPLDPVAEGDAARQAGFTYVCIPVDSKNLSAAQVEEVQRAIAAAPGPCLVH